MAPKRKEIPFDDVIIHIKGLRTLHTVEKKSQDEIAAYYSEKYKTKYSRRTVKRGIDRMIIYDREHANPD